MRFNFIMFQKLYRFDISSAMHTFSSCVNTTKLNTFWSEALSGLIDILRELVLPFSWTLVFFGILCFEE